MSKPSGGFIPIISSMPTAPYTLVQDGWTLLSNMAVESYETATDFVGQLSDFTVAPVNVNVSFTPPELLDPIPMPTPPTEPSLELGEFTDPGLPVQTPVGVLTPGTAPVFTGVAPYIQYNDEPLPLDAEAPTDAPVVSDVVLPESPVLDYPDVPTLLDLTIPTIPATTIPLFTGTAPDDSTLLAPDTGLIWSEAAYTPTLAGLATKLADMLLFDYDAAETAIWERGQERVIRTTDLAVRQLYNDFAARGLSLPTGTLLEADMELRSKQADTLADNAREAMIKAAEVNRDKLALAIQQGVVYESQLMTYSGQRAQRALEAAKATADIAVAVFNAQVSIFNAKVQAYSVDAQVYRELIQAELAKLEQYKLVLDGQKLISDINVQNIEIYKAQHQALLTQVEVYKAQVDAVKTEVEVDKVRIDAFKALVDSYVAQVNGKTAEYSAWAESIKGEAAKMDVYEAEVKAFASMVDAYRTGESVKIDAIKLDIDKNQLYIQEYQARLAYFSEQIKAELARVTTAIQVYDGTARVYSANVGAVTSENQVQISNSELALKSGSTTAELYLKQAELDINQVQRTATLEAAALEAAGKTTAGLSQAAMAAFNLGATVSGSSGYSWGQQLSESWSGELVTAN